VVRGNITLLELPSYSLELNPVERVWHYLRSHWLANSVFASLADIMDAGDGLEPVRHQPPPDPFALRGRLGSSFARSIGGTLLYGLRSKAHSCPEIFGDPYKTSLCVTRSSHSAHAGGPPLRVGKPSNMSP